MRSEQARFDFLVARDGLEEALDFAACTYKIYRMAVLHNGRRTLPAICQGKRHFAATPEYRKTFIQSYLYLKQQVLNHG